MPTERIPVERRVAMTPEEFRNQHLQMRRPVVITHALSWPALEKWSFEWFRDVYGDFDVELSVNPTHTQKVVNMKLGVYVQRILSNAGMTGGLYLDQFPLSKLPALKEDYSIPQFCDPAREIKPHLWIGPGTTVLSFHKDNHSALVPVDNIFVQIRGYKKILLADPDNDPFMYPRSAADGAEWHSQVNPEQVDLARFPAYSEARVLEATVGPGDVIYIPQNYWHYVRALEPSISMSFWWIPSQLSVVCDKLLRNVMAVSDDCCLTLDDIEEFGGMEQFVSALKASSEGVGGVDFRERLLTIFDEDTRNTLRVRLCMPR